MEQQTDNAAKQCLSTNLSRPCGETSRFLQSQPLAERIEALVDRLRVYCDQARLEAERARVDRKFLVEFMLNVQDLLIEFAKTADWMKFKRQIQILRNREGARASVDNWFWRPEKGLELKEQLARRAAYLKAQNYSLDQQWDLLVDFVAGWTGAENGAIDEALLRQVLKEAHNVGPS